jgi:hypothetical protein
MLRHEPQPSPLGLNFEQPFLMPGMAAPCALSFREIIAEKPPAGVYSVPLDEAQQAVARRSTLFCATLALGVGMAKTDLIVVREFDADLFHRKVLELEEKGYSANRETYRITPEMDPETGNIIHLHSIEMAKSQE